jgi:hypothetical protein
MGAAWGLIDRFDGGSAPTARAKYMGNRWPNRQRDFAKIYQFSAWKRASDRLIELNPHLRGK